MPTVVDSSPANEVPVFQYGTPGAHDDDAPLDHAYGARRQTGMSPSRFATRRIGAAGLDEHPSKPARGVKRVDIDLVNAAFDDAVRLLADAGRFNVVVQTSSASAVTVRLRDVDPFDALVAISEARGLFVHFRRGIVVVSDGRATDD